MNEFKRCMNVFTHSPFKVRLMLLNMLCDMFNNKPQQDDKSSLSGVAVRRFIFPSQTPCKLASGRLNPDLLRICSLPRKTSV